MKRTLVFLIPILILAYFGFYYYVKISGAEQGELAPDFEAELIDGTHFQLSDLRGQYVLLDFWGSWCAPCRKASPSLVALHQKHSDNLYIVTIALEKTDGAGQKAAIQDGYIWETQIVEQQAIVMLSDIARKYGVSEIPSKFLISPEGKLLPEMTFEEIDELMNNLK